MEEVREKSRGLGVHHLKEGCNHELIHVIPTIIEGAGRDVDI